MSTKTVGIFSWNIGSFNDNKTPQKVVKNIETTLKNLN